MAACSCHPVLLGSRNTLHSRDMASEVVAIIPADTHLHAYEIRTRLLGLPRPDLGQPSILRLHSIRYYL